MCVSKLGQFLYGAFAVAILALTVGSLFTPGWRTIQAELRNGTDKGVIINETMSKGIFPFGCAFTEKGDRKHDVFDSCAKWFEDQPTYEKVVIAMMFIALVATLFALAWNILTFFCCIGKGWVFRPLPSLAAASAVCLLVAICVFYFNNQNDIDIIKSWDQKNKVTSTDVNYSFYLAIGALLLSLVNVALGAVVVQAAEKCL